MGRRGYPSEFRSRVVALAESGRSIKELADDLGIGEQTIYTWRKLSEQQQPVASADPR